ncbi:hypothetical protein [Vibrio sp. WXL103]|uniref:hypothetical protein n=1 Tax=Vibrio sp. WXL103 TaxID=3450710 RepID=UPI003EC6F417
MNISLAPGILTRQEIRELKEKDSALTLTEIDKKLLLAQINGHSFSALASLLDSKKARLFQSALEALKPNVERLTEILEKLRKSDFSCYMQMISSFEELSLSRDEPKNSHDNHIDKHCRTLAEVSRQSFTKKEIETFSFLMLCTIRLRRKDNKELYWFLLNTVLVKEIELVNRLPLRYRISLLDSFVDCGSSEQAKAALLVVTFVNSLRVLITLDELGVVNYNALKGECSNKYYTELGIETYQLHNGDSLYNNLNRIDMTLKTNPVINKIWKSIENDINAYSQSGLINSIYKDNKSCNYFSYA